MNFMNDTRKKIATLNCRILDNLPEGKKPLLTAVICHGFGAPGDDLLPIGMEFLQASDILSQHLRFIFPEAPHSLEAYGMYGARAWWMIDMEKLNQAMMTGQMRDLRRDLPEGMEETGLLFQKFLDVLMRENSLNISDLLLGGFSQGSMLCCDIALRFSGNPAALILWSSTLLKEDQWRALAKQHTGLKVFQSHGRQDPMLPYVFAEELREILRESGAEVEFLPFEGGHTISMEVMRDCLKWLESIVLKCRERRLGE
jgi:phospholipase/carboxylesterase